jgi:Domain of unknown function (DUF4440)
MSAGEPVELEQAGWHALCSGPEDAVAFYDRVLDDHVVVLLPGGMRLDDRAAIVHSMGGPPWSGFRLEDPRTLRPTTDTAVVTYGVVAERRGSAPYSALISSFYVLRDDGWRLAVHQQTPR